MIIVADLNDLDRLAGDRVHNVVRRFVEEHLNDDLIGCGLRDLEINFCHGCCGLAVPGSAVVVADQRPTGLCPGSVVDTGSEARPVEIGGITWRNAGDPLHDGDRVIERNGVLGGLAVTAAEYRFGVLDQRFRIAQCCKIPEIRHQLRDHGRVLGQDLLADLGLLHLRNQFS